MLSLEHGVDAPLYRPGTDFGETTYPATPTSTVRVARQWESPVGVRGDEGGRAFTQTGRLYVYRTADVRDGDKVVLPEGAVIVRGPAENDYVHPMNGHEFGVKRFTMNRM